MQNQQTPHQNSFYCPMCKTGVIPNLKGKCKVCGSRLLPTKKTLSSSCIISIIIGTGILIIVGILLIGAATMPKPYTSPSATLKPNTTKSTPVVPIPSSNISGINITSRICVQDEVKKYLRSPSTAEFPWILDVESPETNPTITSYVDSQNGFGAKVRTYFTCKPKGLNTELNTCAWVECEFFE